MANSFTSRESHRHQEGSAYLVALMVLVLLSIIGVSLVLVTQTEAQIGATERIVSRNFYAADSGLAVGTARVLVAQDRSPLRFRLSDEVAAGSQLFGKQDEVAIDPVVPILAVPCNLCQINTDRPYYKINNLVRSTATRFGISGGTRHPIAQKTVSVMIELQPTEPPSEFEDLFATP